jgi:hypothetical protein
VLDVVLGLGVLAAVGLRAGCSCAPPSSGPLRALGLTLVVVVVLGPVVQPWYLLWGVVLLAAVADQRSLLALGALSAALCFAVLPSGKSVVRPPLYGLPVVAAAGLAALEVRRATLLGARARAARAAGGRPVSARELDAAGIRDPELRASYEACRRLNASHGKTYYLATLLLPAWKRPVRPRALRLRPLRRRDRRRPRPAR